MTKRTGTRDKTAAPEEVWVEQLVGRSVTRLAQWDIEDAFWRCVDRRQLP